jgi:hypothetical protein
MEKTVALAHSGRHNAKSRAADLEEAAIACRGENYRQSPASSLPAGNCGSGRTEKFPLLNEVYLLTGTTGAVPAFAYMRVPSHRSVKGFKKPASHRDLFVTICDGIDQLARDRHVSPERVRAELGTLKRKCSRHLTGYLAKTATPKPAKGRGLRVKKKQKIHPR